MPSPLTCRLADADEQIAAQKAAIARFEAALWADGFDEKLLASYQSAWRRLEALLERHGERERHRFVVVIPVADSPVHLRDCLASLLELCNAYGYGGLRDGRWHKVSVLLADDSGDADAIARHRAIAADFTRRGLVVEYFGLAEQLALMDGLADLDLSAIVGRHPREAFHHKGQAMTRNIAYLKCAALQAANPDEPLLVYTLDADQEFRVNVATPEGPRGVCAVNFLHHLDAIFADPAVEVLTGKVVGDPPVSPSVMAGNFLEDVLGFLHEMASSSPDAPYRQPHAGGGGDAAYHDMADLFGFKPAGQPYRFHCPLPGTLDNAACFAAFAARLNSFFHGEHPTRITWYQPADPAASVQPARTVYTGNYVFRPAALRWFIPFAPLRLRMSGPTMGRMLQAEMGAGFVSANLPMLHKRTLEATGQSEFRPGVHDASRAVDLCDESERQFHGDVMLFAMQRLAALGYPRAALPESLVDQTLAELRAEMRERYHAKQQAILQRLDLLTTVLRDPNGWWHAHPELAEANAAFESFAANIARNFAADSPCQARLDAAARCEDWHARQRAAILGLHADRQAWNAALARLGLPSPAGGGAGGEGATHA
ncbi:MAG: hypothetical protein AB1831_00800 [Pseudomonadota bacterium]